MPVSPKFKDLFAGDYNDSESGASNQRKPPYKLTNKPPYNPPAIPPVLSHASPDDPALHRKPGLLTAEEVNPVRDIFATPRSSMPGYPIPKSTTELKFGVEQVVPYINGIISQIGRTEEEAKTYQEYYDRIKLYDEVKRAIYHPLRGHGFVPRGVFERIQLYLDETGDKPLSDMMQRMQYRYSVPEAGNITENGDDYYALDEAYRKACRYFQDKLFKGWRGYPEYEKDLAAKKKKQAKERKKKSPEWQRDDKGGDSLVVKQARDYWDTKCGRKRRNGTSPQDDVRIPEEVKKKIDSVFKKRKPDKEDAVEEKVVELLDDFQKNHEFKLISQDISNLAECQKLKSERLDRMYSELMEDIHFNIAVAQDYWDSKCGRKRRNGTDPQDDVRIPEKVKEVVDKVFDRMVYDKGVAADAKRKKDLYKGAVVITPTEAEHHADARIDRFLNMYAESNNKYSWIANGARWGIARGELVRHGAKILDRVLPKSDLSKYIQSTKDYVQDLTLAKHLKNLVGKIESTINDITELEDAGQKDVPYDYLDHNAHWPNVVTDSWGRKKIIPPHDEQSAREEAILGNYKSLMDSVTDLCTFSSIHNREETLGSPILEYQGYINKKIKEYSSKLDKIWANSKDESTLEAPTPEASEANSVGKGGEAKGGNKGAGGSRRKNKTTGKNKTSEGTPGYKVDRKIENKTAGNKTSGDGKTAGNKTSGDGKTPGKGQTPGNKTTGNKTPKSETSGKGKTPKSETSGKGKTPDKNKGKTPKSETSGKGKTPKSETSGKDKTPEDTPGTGNPGDAIEKSIEHFNQVFATTIMKSSKERLTQGGRRHGAGVIRL